jgi:two-component system C4-dicarboxylate transport sensor histidine kinase DctB
VEEVSALPPELPPPSDDEIRRLRDLLAAAGRLAEFGRFAAKQIHELRQPLFAIKGLAQLLLEKERVDLDEVLDFARHIVEQSERLTALVSNLRQLSLPPAAEATHRVEISSVLLRVTSLLEFRLRRAGTTLRTQIAPDLPPLAAVPNALEQILINLLANALDAVTGAPQPVVQVRARVLAENPRFAVIEVADNGAGIAKTVRNRLFESFFTTKGDEQGTGLGLAVSRELARSSGGELALLDDPGTWCFRRGATCVHLKSPLLLTPQTSPDRTDIARQRTADRSRPSGGPQQVMAPSRSSAQV